jgi:predicted Zn-ribbon and HTH transcriptional regulator
MQISADRYRRDRRAFDLAWRMIGHGARTNTISRWTGLPERRIRRLQRSYGVETSGAAPKRPRGRSPYRIELLLRAPRMRKEALALAQLCRDAGLLSADIGYAARTKQPDFDKGERLCSVFETFKSNSPDSIITIEQMFLLVAALSRHEEIDLALCVGCGQAAIVDLLKVAPQSCENCGYAFRSEANSPCAHAARVGPPSGLARSVTLDRSLPRARRRPGCSLSRSKGS